MNLSSSLRPRAAATLLPQTRLLQNNCALPVSCTALFRATWLSQQHRNPQPILRPACQCPACLSVCLPACPPACLYVTACLPACLHACLHACMHACLSCLLPHPFTSMIIAFVVFCTKHTSSSFSCVTICIVRPIRSGRTLQAQKHKAAACSTCAQLSAT